MIAIQSLKHKTSVAIERLRSNSKNMFQKKRGLCEKKIVCATFVRYLGLKYNFLNPPIHLTN